MRQLFGGAIECAFPAEFVDVSSLRQIPDNQEVFAQAETDRSLIFDLLESEADIPPREAAPATFHWQVLARDTKSTNPQITHSRDIPASDLSPVLRSADPGVHVSVAYGIQNVAKFKDASDASNSVRVCLACVRLPRASTDLLIVLNDPVAIHPESQSAKVGSSVFEPQVADEEQRTVVLSEAINSLRIADWSLFG